MLNLSLEKHFLFLFFVFDVLYRQLMIKFTNCYTNSPWEKFFFKKTRHFVCLQLVQPCQYDVTVFIVQSEALVSRESLQTQSHDLKTQSDFTVGHSVKARWWFVVARHLYKVSCLLCFNLSRRWPSFLSPSLVRLFNFCCCLFLSFFVATVFCFSVRIDCNHKSISWRV